VIPSGSAIPPSATIAGIAALVPLVVEAFAAWLPQSAITLPDIFFAALAYGAVVLSVMSGVRLGAGTESSSAGLAIGALPALAGCVALLIPPLLGLCLLIAGFFLQAFSNVMSTDQGRLPQWFGKLSSLLTLGVVLVLLALIVRLLI
jgi:hypothetical protein